MKVFLIPSESLKEVIKNVDPTLIEAIPNHDKEGIAVGNLKKVTKTSVCSIGKNLHIHELLSESQVILPSPPEFPRNPELDARVKVLQVNYENMEYSNMTKNLEPLGRRAGKKPAFADDVKTMNKQLTLLINFVLTVGGCFFFSYKAVEYALPEPNMAVQMFFAVITATIVALADLYFLIARDL